MADDMPDRAGVRVFPPAAPLAVVLGGVALDALLPLGEGPGPPWRYWVGGAIIAGAVLLLGLWSIVLMRRSGQTENPYKPTFSIVERGPFRITRNPMYLQMVAASLGFAVLLWSPWILILAPLGALALHRLAILPEEAYLERKFGEEYLAYKRRVRRWI